jgi:hypothetical protein
MAIVYWIGKAAAVAQVGNTVVTAYDAATTYILTVNGQTVSALGDTDTTATAVALALAWNTSTHPYFTGVTASNSTNTVILTADTAGVSFTTTSSVTGGTGTIGAVSTPTANAGPNDWSTAGNWSGGSVPVNSDTAVLENTTDNIAWGLDQSAVTLTELRILRSYSGLLGLPQGTYATSSDGASVSTAAVEYRDDYLKVGATALNIGGLSGVANELGSGRIKIDLGSVQTTATVFGSDGTPTDTDHESVRLLGTHASNMLNVVGGNVGTATENAGQVSTWTEINVNQPDDAGSVAMNIGLGCTLTTLNISGGVMVNRGANATTVNKNGGTYTVFGSATHTTVNNSVGTFNHNSNGTITTLVTGGRYDTRGDPRDKTITNCTVTPGYEILANTGNPLSVTFTNGIDFSKSTVEDGILDIGTDYTLTPSAI